jgi:hypothetical protein
MIRMTETKLFRKFPFRKFGIVSKFGFRILTRPKGASDLHYLGFFALEVVVDFFHRFVG